MNIFIALIFLALCSISWATNLCAAHHEQEPNFDQIRLWLKEVVPEHPRLAAKELARGCNSQVYEASPISLSTHSSESSVSAPSSRNPSRLPTPGSRKKFINPQGRNNYLPLPESPEYSSKRLPRHTDAVVKHRTSDQNSGSLELEAAIQKEIRKALQKKGYAPLARYIPVVGKKGISVNKFKMERGSGKQLKQIIAETNSQSTYAPVSFCVVGFMTKLIELVSAIHELGYAHEDISPKNIIVDPTKVDNKNVPDFKLIDFGMSGKIGEKRIDPEFAENYVAPERMTPGVIDDKADTFSLGKIFLELLDFSKEKKLYPELYDKIKDIALDMTAENPENRISLKLAFGALSEIKRGQYAPCEPLIINLSDGQEY